MDKFKQLQKRLDKILKEYESMNSPAEEKAFNAGKIAGFKRAMEIIDSTFQEVISQ